MKFTSLAVAALFLANTSAVLLQKQAKDDCGGKWCNKGLAYDLDEATLRKAEADNAAKTQHFNAASTAAKAASDANLKANQDRVTWEKDQLVKGEDQDRLKHVNENTAAKTSEIQGKHDERERANGRLLKAP